MKLAEQHKMYVRSMGKPLEEEMTHTPGAIKAAEAITCHAYDASGKDRKRFPTTRGDKTVAGIAAIIDTCTSAPELRMALDRLARAAANRENTMGDPMRLIEAQAELRDATGQARALL